MSLQSLKQDGDYIMTKRCVHSVKNLTKQCNINITKYEKVSKEFINLRLEEFKNLKKCDNCIPSEDLEFVDDNDVK